MGTRTVDIGGKGYAVARMPLSAVRGLLELDEQLTALQVRVDGLDAQLASASAQLVDMAESGEATEESVKPITDREADLINERRRLGLEQIEIRVRRLALRLEAAEPDELLATVDLGELDSLEEQVVRPTTAPGETDS